MKPKSRSLLVTQLLYSLIAGLLIGIVALALFLLHNRLNPPEPVESGSFRIESGAIFEGVITIDPPLAIQDFTLTNQEGEATSLSDLRGKHILLTFGFTHCPDICPLTLNDFDRTREMLGAAAEKIHFVFISVDGSRDTPEVLKQYLAFREFDRILALTGAESKVRDLGGPLGLSFEISDEAVPGGYQVNHTVGFFLLDPEGRWIQRFQFGVAPSTIVAELRKLLAT